MSIFKIIRILPCAIFIIQNLALAIDEQSVFEWWDAGLISPDEAGEMLNLIEEGNSDEACLIAEAYSLEDCTTQKPAKGTAKGSNKKEAKSPMPHGYAQWKGRTDSLGHLTSNHLELQVDFYRYRLRLGSQSLLAYKNDGSEAYFGDISTKEIHSYIPIDTLWGTTLLYPIGNFNVSGTLDTSRTMQVRLGYAIPKTLALGIFYWNSPVASSYGIHAKASWVEIASWWQAGDRFPLTKVQLQNATKGDPLSWKFAAYIHGNNTPDLAKLSQSIEKNQLWSTQSVSYRGTGSWQTVATFNSRVTKALGDTAESARFKLQAESGPKMLRGSASATCLEATEGCPKNDFKFALASQFADPEKLSLTGSFKVRHTQSEGFGAPNIQFGTSYSTDRANMAALTLILPKGSPKEGFQMRSQANVGTNYLQTSLAVTFKHTKTAPFHPMHAFMQVKLLF